MLHTAPPARLPGLILLLMLLSGAAAQAGPAALCEVAARIAAQATGVPLPVLRAIALTETGRQRGGAVEPWPWTTHAAGEGRWFDTRSDAQAHVRALRARGVESIDIGCFQVNLRWHGAAFASPDAMFDPEANALYAARFLSGLHAEFGDWERAAGAYHSRTPELAARYTARFRDHLARLGPDDGLRGARALHTRRDGPLLQPATGPLRAGIAPPPPGSLVAQSAARGPLFPTTARALR